MIFALVAMDVVWALGLVGVSIPAAYAASETYARTSPSVGSPIAAVLAFVAFVIVYVVDVCLVLFVLPTARPGKHMLLRGRDFYLWSASFIVRRWLDIPPIGALARQSAVAKIAMLRAAGATVHASANMSSDVVILDPHLLTLGANTILGSGVVVAGHIVVDGILLLAPIVIGDGTEVGADVRVGPGVRIGERARIQTGVILTPNVEVGDEATIGLRAVLGPRTKVGRGARVAANVHVPQGTTIADGASYP